MTSAGFIPSAASTPPLTNSSTCSTFTGRHLCTHTQSTPTSFPTQIYMKKSRFHQPLQPKRQERMPLPEDGTPVFAIFVRTTRAKLWYPLGAVQGDKRSKGLVDALKGNFGRGMYQNALDKGIAQTVYGKDGDRYVQNAVRMYPQLKKYTKQLEFGYRVSAVGLDEQPTKPVSKEMALPFAAWAKKKMDDALKGVQG